jgi:hypothetical protein
MNKNGNKRQPKKQGGRKWKKDVRTNVPNSTNKPKLVADFHVTINQNLNVTQRQINIIPTLSVFP